MCSSFVQTILQEIEKQFTENGVLGHAPILILTKDERACFQLQHYLAVVG
jgi:hypothetical protein